MSMESSSKYIYIDDHEIEVELFNGFRPTEFRYKNNQYALAGLFLSTELNNDRPCIGTSGWELTEEDAENAVKTHEFYLRKSNYFKANEDYAARNVVLIGAKFIPSNIGCDEWNSYVESWCDDFRRFKLKMKIQNIYQEDK